MPSVAWSTSRAAGFVAVELDGSQHTKGHGVTAWRAGFILNAATSIKLVKIMCLMKICALWGKGLGKGHLWLLRFLLFLGSIF